MGKTKPAADPAEQPGRVPAIRPMPQTGESAQIGAMMQPARENLV
jgi:hypothetical protein